MNGNQPTCLFEVVEGDAIVATDHMNQVIAVGRTLQAPGDVTLRCTNEAATMLSQVLNHYAALTKESEIPVGDRDLLAHVALSLVMAVALNEVTPEPFPGEITSLIVPSKAPTLTIVRNPAGVCRECGCTDYSACEDILGSCSWVDTARNLCSACAVKNPSMAEGAAQ